MTLQGSRRSARWARSWVAVAALATTAGGVWLGAPPAAAACSCAPKPTPAEARTRADAVFEGRVYGVATVGHRTRYSFEVDRYWKGELPERIELLSNTQSAACGRNFELGRPYLVYARRSAGDLIDTICSRTRPAVAAAEDLAVLGDATTPAVTDDSAHAIDPGAPPQEPPRVVATEAPAPIAPAAKGCAVDRGAHRATHEVAAFLATVLVLAWGRRRRARWR